MTVKLSSEQTKVVSGIFANLGHVFFASTVIPFVLSSTTKIDFLSVLFGAWTAICLWVASTIAVKNL